MKRIALFALILPALLPAVPAQDGLVPAFPLAPDGGLAIMRPAQPAAPFDRAGRRAALIGTEGGAVEAWAWPLKLVRNLELSFLLRGGTRPIPARDIVRFAEARPECEVLTFVHQSFTVRAVYLVPFDQPGALILLDVRSDEPLTVIGGFLPVLQPMWPAGIGGQYAAWDDDLKAYVISESSRRHHALVGSPRAAGISYTPAHMLADTPSEFRLEIPDPAAVAGKFIPIALAGGSGPREEVVAAYRALLQDPRALYLQTADHFLRLRRATLKIKTPEPELDRAFEWAKIALDTLAVDNPDLGKGMVAGIGASGTGGRPGFGWFFGGDSCINAFSLTAMGAPAAAKEALAFLPQWQREDGKMAHEIPQSFRYVDWFKDYGFGYIHADTSPFFVVAVGDYYRATGDAEFVRQQWPALQKAYAWCRSTDANGDGLMDNAQAGLGALEYGALTGIATDVYLAAVWTRAAETMIGLAEAAGDAEAVRQAAADFVRAREAFEKFWDEGSGQYAYAFSEDGKRVAELSPWSAVGLMWGQGTPEHAGRNLERIGSAELTTDWGVRSISTKSRYFEPLNYNYGAVWPFLGGWVAAAQFQRGFPQQGYATLLATARHTFDNAAGSVTEVFSGARNAWPAEAVAHQGFSSAAVVLPLVRGLFGLEGDAAARKLRFAPRLPAHWGEARVENFRLGPASFTFACTRRALPGSAGFQPAPGADAADSLPPVNDEVFEIVIQSDNALGWQLQLAPLFGPGTRIAEVAVDGKPARYTPPEGRQGIQPVVTVTVQSATVRVAFRITPAVEILPPPVESRTGDADEGLKLIRVARDGDRLRVVVEGLAGRVYLLPLTHPEQIGAVEGGLLLGSAVRLKIPEAPGGGFAPHTVTIRMK